MNQAYNTLRFLDSTVFLSVLEIGFLDSSLLSRRVAGSNPDKVKQNAVWPNTFLQYHCSLESKERQNKSFSVPQIKP